MLQSEARAKALEEISGGLLGGGLMRMGSSRVV